MPVRCSVSLDSAVFQQDESISESFYSRLPLTAQDWRKINMKTVLSILRTDPTGGAGIQTDLKTFENLRRVWHGRYHCRMCTNTTGVFGMQPVSAELVGKQIDCVFDDIFLIYQTRHAA